MSFKGIGLLVNDLLECFVKKENEQIEKSSLLSRQLRERLETDFKVELSPELKIQWGEEIEPELIEPVQSSTPLKTEEIENIYNQEKEDLLKTAITINKTDLETSVENAENSNKAIINEIINATPGLIVDDTVNVDSQLDFEKEWFRCNF